MVPRPSNSGSLSVPLIKAVDASSPAQNGRLKQDDRLIGVNGYYVDNKPHLDLVILIKRGGSSAWLLVVDREADEHIYSQMKRKPVVADAVYGQQDTPKIIQGPKSLPKTMGTF